jgi:hypothetical protein
MDIVEERIFYGKVSKARESIAGSNIQKEHVTIEYIQDAINYGTKISIPEEYMTKITQALGIMKNAKEYGDRLPADNLLCEILNTMRGSRT